MLIKFITSNSKPKNKPTLDINIVCDDNLITTLPNIEFLGIYIYIHIYIHTHTHTHTHTHDSINWSCHIEYIIRKLASTCYIMRSIKPFMSLNTLKHIYYSYFNAILNYGLPFWGNSPNSIIKFKKKKKKNT
jgi:hypothetical protein